MEKMKIKIEIVEEMREPEIIIQCHRIDDTIQRIEQAIGDIHSGTKQLCFYQEEKEFYLSLEEILFFETEDNKVNAHTEEQIYLMKYRLYELEEILPKNFIRISKSTIVNIEKIYSISKGLTSPNSVQFYKSYKQVYVSRYYLKNLKERLQERRK